jgi:hypothetical protein
LAVKSFIAQVAGVKILTRMNWINLEKLTSNLNWTTKSFKTLKFPIFFSSKLVEMRER